MNGCFMNITIQQQVNESWELNNYLIVFIQGDACHLVADIQNWLITYDEKEKMQSGNLNLPHILGWSYWFIRKKLRVLKTDHLLAEIKQVQVHYLRASTIYNHKMPYHSAFLNSCAERNRNTKRIYKHCQESFVDIYATHLFYTLELVSLSQMKVK